MLGIPTRSFKLLWDGHRTYGLLPILFVAKCEILQIYIISRKKKTFVQNLSLQPQPKFFF